MGSMTSSTALRNGENTLFATDFTPEVMPCVRPLRSSEMIERDSDDQHDDRQRAA